MHILTIDIETSPNLAYVFDLWQKGPVTIDKLVDTCQMMCFAAKWLDEDPMMFHSAQPRGRRSADASRQEMVLAAWELLDEADAVIHYNGRHFDVPHLQREFLALGLTPPSPYRQIDLLDAVRKQFRFPSNKLDYVTQALGLPRKVSHQGFSLWVQCLANEPKAWGSMQEYNEADVIATEALYHKLRPWIPRHPSHGAMSGEDVCPACGSHELTPHGFAYLLTGAYQRYQCAECGKWSRSTKRSHATHIAEVTTG